MSLRVSRGVTAVVIAALFAISLSSFVFAQRISTASVTPNIAAPGASFLFVAPGFKGAVPSSESSKHTGERIAYWIQLPDGSIISTEPGKDHGDNLKAFMTRANGYGEVAVRWTSQRNALTGPYLMVLHGLSSNTEVTIPFTIRPQNTMTVLQNGATPTSAPAGAEFRFVATGFNDHEEVAYWYNLPDGSIIATRPTDKTEFGNKAVPLRDSANRDGMVTIVWSSPPTLKPGLHTIVLHGLDSQHEVLIYFSITQ